MTERRAVRLGDLELEGTDRDVTFRLHGEHRLTLTVDEARAVAVVGIPAVLPQGERVPPERQADACAEPQTTPQRPQTPGREPLF